MSRMTSDTRRSLALLLVGLAAALIGMSAATALLRDVCLDAGGRWLESRTCEAASRPLPGPGRAYLIGAGIGVVAGVVLWRVYTFYATRARRGAPSR
jgi:hypothetical protein